MILKQKIRRKILDIRNNMKRQEAVKLSDEIITNLIRMPIFKESNNVMLYLSFKNEVDTYKLISHCYKEKKNVIAPFTVKEKRKLIPTLLRDLNKELTQSTFGYMEPKPEYVKPIDVGEIDIIIIPGVAFDKRGYRIGFGGGYYDRFLPKLLDKVPKVAIAYDFQILERVPNEDFDIPLDYIVTEKRIIVR